MPDWTEVVNDTDVLGVDSSNAPIEKLLAADMKT